MAKIKNWSLLQDNKKRKVWRNDNRGVVVKVEGRNRNGDNVAFKGSHGSKVIITEDNTSKSRLDKSQNKRLLSPWKDELFEDVSKGFKSKSKAVEYARNWMKKHPNPSKYRKRSEKEKELIRKKR